MKTTLLKITSLFALASFATAQEPSEPSRPLAPPGPPGPPKQALEKQELEIRALQFKAEHLAPTFSLSIPAGDLQTALEAVRAASEKADAKPLNLIVLSPLDTPVPALLLRNVTGSDALNLLAAAAQLDLTIVANPQTGNMAGWKLAGQAAPLPLSAPTDEKSRLTRVYPLRNIAPRLGMEDIDRGLRQVLDADGVKQADVKFSFHEKTNVLLVNGTRRSHELIMQMLSAFGQESVKREDSEAVKKLAALENVERRNVELMKELEAARARQEEYQEQVVKLRAELEAAKVRAQLLELNKPQPR